MQVAGGQQGEPEVKRTGRVEEVDNIQLLDTVYSQEPLYALKQVLHRRRLPYTRVSLPPSTCSGAGAFCRPVMLYCARMLLANSC